MHGQSVSVHVFGMGVGGVVGPGGTPAHVTRAAGLRMFIWCSISMSEEDTLILCFALAVFKSVFFIFFSGLLGGIRVFWGLHGFAGP